MRRARIVLTLLVVALLVTAAWRARRVAAPAPGTSASTARSQTSAPVVKPAPVTSTPGPTAPAAAGSVTGSTRAAWLARSLPESLQRPGATTIGEALVFAEQLAPGTDRSQFLQALLEYGLEIDPVATVAAAVEFRDASLREHAVTFALGAWAQRDAVAALQWAASHPRADNDATWFCAAYEGFAAKKPAEALALLQRPELGADVDALARIVAFHFDEQGRLDEARASAEKLPEGPVREALMTQIAHYWAMRAPGEAAAWLASAASDATFRDGMTTIVQTVAANEPSFAAGLAQRFPDGRSGKNLLGDVIYLWAQRDLGGAAAWLRTQTPGPKLDAAIVRFVETIAPNDPVEARGWLKSITDPEQRTAVAQRLGRGG